MKLKKNNKNPFPAQKEQLHYKALSKQLIWVYWIFWLWTGML